MSAICFCWCCDSAKLTKQKYCDKHHKIQKRLRKHIRDCYGDHAYEQIMEEIQDDSHFMTVALRKYSKFKNKDGTIPEDVRPLMRSSWLECLGTGHERFEQQFEEWMNWYDPSLAFVEVVD